MTPRFTDQRGAADVLQFMEVLTQCAKISPLYRVIEFGHLLVP